MNTKHKTLVFFTSLFVLITSCTDSILDLQPEQAVSDAVAVVDQKSAEAALNGAYNLLQSEAYYGGTGFIAAINLAGDNVTWTGSLNYYRDFNTHGYLADNTSVEVAWNVIYKTIDAANQVIDKVAVLSNIDASAKSRIIGEALFIRALAHFDLARTWANVPIITKGTSTVNDFDGVGQSTQTQVYTQVVADLDKSLTLLPATLNRTRATKASVHALLARAHLYMEHWDEAEHHATLLINDPNYELIDYPQFFAEKCSRELILELETGRVMHWHQWLSPDQGGRHEWAPSDSLVALLSQSAIGGTRSALIRNESTANKLNYYVGLLYHRTNGDDPAYLFRLAEQYLIRAEARAKKANPILPQVLADLNAVKLRAKAQASTATTIEQAILDIENERRVEFAFEPHRWFDLVRTARAGVMLGVTDTNKWIFPIPYNDLQADKDLKQNKGYGKE